jgi:hypothetical protein
MTQRFFPASGRASWLASGLLVTLFASALPVAHADPADGKKYSVKVEAPDAKVGKLAHAQIRVFPGTGMHVNMEFPASLTVAVPQGVDGPTGKLKPNQLDKSAASFDVGFTPREIGPKTFSGTVSFAICDDAQTQCDPRREQVQFTVNVK